MAAHWAWLGTGLPPLAARLLAEWPWAEVPTTSHAFGPVHVVARWSRKDQWPRFWATDLPADRHAWRRGRKPFWIEPSFRD